MGCAERILNHFTHGKAQGGQGFGFHGQWVCVCIRFKNLGNIPAGIGYFFHQLRAVECAAVADGGHEARHLQRSDQHVALADGLVGGFQLGGGVDYRTGFFFNLADAGFFAQPKATRHIGYGGDAPLHEQVAPDVVEIRVAGAHQAAGKGQKTGWASLAFASCKQLGLEVFPGPVVEYAVGKFGEIVLAVVLSLRGVGAAFERGGEGDDFEYRAKRISPLRGSVVERSHQGYSTPWLGRPHCCGCRGQTGWGRK